MDRSREAKRASMAVTNGLSRRRQRSSSLRHSPGSLFLFSIIRSILNLCYLFRVLFSDDDFSVLFFC